MATYLDKPPELTGVPAEDIQTLWDYLYKCAERHNVNVATLDSLEQAASNTTTTT